MIVPAPILDFLPTVASSNISKVICFRIFFNRDFLISTKFPTFDPSSKTVPGLNRAYGPIETLLSTLTPSRCEKLISYIVFDFYF